MDNMTNILLDLDILTEVLTATEVAELYHLSPAVVRVTIAKGWLPEGSYRRSGATWLILRSAAEARWGQRRQGDESQA